MEAEGMSEKEKRYYVNEPFYAKQFAGGLENAKEIVGWLNRHGLEGRFFPQEPVPEESGVLFQAQDTITVQTGYFGPTYVGMWIVLNEYGQAGNLSDLEFQKMFFEVFDGK